MSIAAEPAQAAVALRNLTFAYADSAPLLAIDEFTIARGESVFLEGPSGSGKSTLLSLIAGVSRAAVGSVAVLGQDLAALSAGQRDRFRADHLGLVFQQFNLLPTLSMIDNVTLGLRFSAARRQRIQAAGGTIDAAAEALLGQLGLLQEHAAGTPVTRLSVGQQQRVAVARALLGQPDLLIADEPTSALDARARGAFIDLLLAETGGNTTVLFVSHDPALAAYFDRAVELPAINRLAASDAHD